MENENPLFCFFCDSPRGDLYYRLAVTMPKEKTCVSKLIHSKFHFRMLRTLAAPREQSVLYIQVLKHFLHSTP